MKLFETSNGFLMCFGFDMLNRVKNPRMICWNDPSTGSWEIGSTGCAGDILVSEPVAPEFIFERDGQVLAYQPGKLFELTYVNGSPMIWHMRILCP